ncbi:DNA polymerase III subunit delta' [Flavobacteriaceae bacterium]|nr:DNA polymerase III subunit delta' [Flavobacteriaceae bacterium]
MRFSDVLGQEGIKSRLQTAIDSNRLAHAQLFVGAEGSGTLPMALALAREALCGAENLTEEQKRAGHLKMDHLNHPDLHFVYPVAASGLAKTKPISDHYAVPWRAFIQTQVYGNLFDWYQLMGTEKKQGNISVEEARDLSQKLSLKSYEGGYKVMVIWGIEKMNTAAANKILKLLEEPPEKTLFILIAEEEEQLIATITSRCQITYFKKLQEKDIIKGLLAEGAVEQNAKQIAIMAEGNYNKALDLFRQDSEELRFGEWFVFWVRAAFKAKGNKSAINELLNWSGEVAKSGREIQKNFLLYCLSLFREAVLMEYGLDQLQHTQIEVSNFDFKKFAPFVHEGNIEQISTALESAVYEIERNGNAKMVFTDLAISLTRLLHMTKAVTN